MKRRVLWGAFVLSLVLNLFLAYPLLNGWINEPKDRVGRLTRQVEVGEFGGSETLFVLPAGITVRDASPLGFAAIGMFEPHRFSIIVTADDGNLVDYTPGKDGLLVHREYYSAELEGR